MILCLDDSFDNLLSFTAVIYDDIAYLFDIAMFSIAEAEQS